MHSALRLLGIEYDPMFDIEDLLYLCEWVT